MERPAHARHLAHRARAGGRATRWWPSRRSGRRSPPACSPTSPATAGLPDGVFNVVQGLGAEAGAPLAAHPAVARVCFTGSVATGRTVAAAAGAQLTPVSLELGGKSPLLVFADADLDLAVGHAVGQYDNAGQVCLAGTTAAGRRAGGGRVPRALPRTGRGAAPGRPARRADRHRAEHHPGAPGAGGRLRPAGRRGRGAGRCSAARVNPELGGLYYQPTLLAGARAGSEILTEEVFGPVLTLQTFGAEDEAVALANSTQYGLAATLFTGDRERAVAGVGAAGRGHRLGQLLLRPRPAGPVRRGRAVRASAGRAAPGASTSTATSRTPSTHRGVAATMGEVVGAGLLAHVPTIMLPGAERRELNKGKEISLVPGLGGCAPRSSRCSTTTRSWCSTRTGTPRSSSSSPRTQVRAGLFTSDELPRGMCRIPYDWPGDPELAHAMAAQADAHGTWITAIDDPVPAAALRHRQPVDATWAAAWTSGGSRSATRADRRHRGLPAGRPGLGAAIAASEPHGAADRLRRHVAHVLAAARTARARGQRPGPHQDRGGPRRRRTSGSPG